MSMNLDYYECLKEVLCKALGPINPTTFENKTVISFADFFTQKFLIGVYNSNRAEFESSEFLVSSCFYAGIVTNLIYQNIDKTDIEYVGTLQSVLELNLFCIEELLKTSIDVLGEVGWLENIEDKKKILFQQSLTHQIDFNEKSLQMVLTTFYTIFMVSAALELR